MNGVICIALLCAPVMFAQPSRSFFPWWEMPVSRDLNLGEDQQRQIREITREYRTKLIDMRAQVEKTEGELEDLFDEDNFDTQRAIQVSEKLAVARTDLTRAFSVMNARLRGVLTAQQWRELRKRRPGPRGPGPQSGGNAGPRMRRPGPPPQDQN